MSLSTDQICSVKNGNVYESISSSLEKSACSVLQIRKITLKGLTIQYTSINKKKILLLLVCDWQHCSVKHSSDRRHMPYLSSLLKAAFTLDWYMIHTLLKKKMFYFSYLNVSLKLGRDVCKFFCTNSLN